MNKEMKETLDKVAVYEEWAKRKALKAGNNKTTLKIDNDYSLDDGVSYNVVGKIPGKSSKQQIIISGHYDIYFRSFQDDSCAIGLIMAIAKAMKESNYTPENDILFIAHGSEEWGAANTEYDWTTGAWEMINTVHPEWAQCLILNYQHFMMELVKWKYLVFQNMPQQLNNL